MANKRWGIDGSGIHVYWKTPNILVFWLELGPRKSELFVQGGAALAGLALKIPPPWGPVVAAIAAAQVNDVKNKRGPNGVWVKFGPAGYMQSRPRTDANKGKFPQPW
jgi:hypothetical protein